MGLTTLDLRSETERVHDLNQWSHYEQQLGLSRRITPFFGGRASLVLGAPVCTTVHMERQREVFHAHMVQIFELMYVVSSASPLRIPRIQNLTAPEQRDVLRCAYEHALRPWLNEARLYLAQSPNSTSPEAL